MTTLADAGEALSKAMQNLVRTVANEITDGTLSTGEIAACQNCKWWGNSPDDTAFTHKRVKVRPCVFGEWSELQDMPVNGMAIGCGHDGPIYTGPLFGCVNFEAK